MHHGIELRFDGRGHRIDFPSLTGGRSITVYGQQEVVKDLIARAARRGRNRRLRGERRRGARPRIECAALRLAQRTATSVELACDYHRRLRRVPRHLPAGDPRRSSCRSSSARIRSRGSASWPRPHRSHDELIYAYHERGFALFSDAIAGGHATLPAGAARRGHRGLARRAHLERAAHAPRDRRRLEAQRRAGAGKGRHRDAELRLRADAARASLSRGRRRAHRAADRRQGNESRDRRRATCLSRALSSALNREIASGLAAYSRDVSEARVARRAFLVVDDLDAAPLSARRRLSAAAAALAARYVSSSPAAAASLAENYVGLPLD